MSNILENLFYTETHEWLRKESDGSVTLGVTDHAQAAMGDMVYVDLPDVGKKVSANGEVGVLESVKSASDFYTPISGEISAVNEVLHENPALVNQDPYDKGWLVKIKPDNINDIEKLKGAADYKKLLAE